MKLLPTFVLLLALGPLAAQETQTLVTPSGGAYLAPVRLQVQVPPGASARYRFLETSSPATFPWKGSLDLDALPGETRSYSLRLTTDFASGETVTRDYRYRVSRAVEKVPAVTPEPGRYSTSVVLKPTLPPGWSVFEGAAAALFPRTLDTAAGRSATFVFSVRGPQGEALEWKYVVDRRDQESVSLELLSPVPGEWANAQTLAAVFRGTDKVLWSYGEHLDANSAREYLGPVALEGSGRRSVTVAAHSRLDGSWLEKTVTWTNGASAPSPEWPAAAQTSGLAVPEVSGASFSWDEGRSWAPGQAVQESSSQTSRKLLTLRVRKDKDVFRYLYWLDARKPAAPEAEFVGGWNPRVFFTGASEAVYHVVWTKADGAPLAEPTTLWGPTGGWKVPDGIVAAQIRAAGPNGLEGPPVSLGFPETGWSTPVWEPWDQKGPQADKGSLPLGGRVLSRPGFQAVYEVSESPDVQEPGPDSPLLSGAFLPAFPWGSDRTLYVRFAWRDASGLIGPATNAVAIRVDRVPPTAPEVVAVGGQVLLKASDGEEDGGLLLWAVTPERAADADSLTFQPYTRPLDSAALRAGASGRVWFHALMQDRAGNSGPARLNVALAPPNLESSLVQVDPDPSVGETAVENGGVYPWPAFRLRALDQGSSLWVSVTDQTAVPDDWKTRLQPWDGIFSRGIARGQRRSFLVYWNARTADGWAWEQPKSLSLTLDLSAPSPPVIAGSWPSRPLGSAWLLDLRPGRPGDRLRYTFSLDGTTPPDPAVSGETWPGTRIWDTASGSRIVVRVRVAAVSVAGLTVEASLGGAVTIDRAPPAAALPALDPFTYRTSPVLIPAPEGAVVRYTLTSDGSLPPVPGDLSAAVPPSGLFLEGREGQSVLYRFRWRSYSAAGGGGSATDAYGVLVDRTAGTSASSASEVVPVAAPVLEGVPERGISPVPVTLKLAGSGLVRFEVREGLGSAPPVTADSALWTQALVLDAGAGVDRSYAISLRSYSPEGTPLTEEVVYQIRVDRSLPGVPEVDLVSDTRRPEATLRYSSPTSDEQLLYRWSWESFASGKGTGEWTALTPAPAVFSAPGGAITRLKLEAYLRDEAGNSGPPVERVALIDQNVVYLAAGGTGDGSRGRPLGTVQGAVELARREGKSQLLAASGSYRLTRTLDLGGIQVVGGLVPEAWESTTDFGRSVWTADGSFAGDSLIESADRGWSLVRVDLSTNVRLAQVVDVKNGSVVVRDSTWTWSGTGRGWAQEGGRLEWSGVAVGYTAEPRATLFDLRSLEATVRGLRLSATQNQGGVLVSMNAVKALFQDLVLVSKQAQDFDGVWSASQSQLTVDGALIQAGEGADRSTAFVLKDSDTTMWNTEVYLYGALANTGFQTTSGRLEILKNTLGLLKGKEFNQGLALDRTETVIRSLDFKVESGSYQGGLSVDGGSLKMASSRFRLTGGGQKVWGGQFYTSPLVTLEDVAWTLLTKTPGELWKLDKPWNPASSVKGSQTTGW